jgi:hypothetical protein
MLITLDLPIELEKKLQTQAEMNQITLNQLIEKLLHFQLIGQQQPDDLSNRQKMAIRSQIQHLSEIGLVAWSGNRLSPITPITPLQKWPTVADLLLEDRG